MDSSLEFSLQLSFVISISTIRVILKIRFAFLYKQYPFKYHDLSLNISFLDSTFRLLFSPFVLKYSKDMTRLLITEFFIILKFSFSLSSLPQEEKSTSIQLISCFLKILLNFDNTRSVSGYCV